MLYYNTQKDAKIIHGRVLIAWVAVSQLMNEFPLIYPNKALHNLTYHITKERSKIPRKRVFPHATKFK